MSGIHSEDRSELLAPLEVRGKALKILRSRGPSNEYGGDYWTASASTGGFISKQDVDSESTGSYVNVSLMLKLD